MRRRNSVPSVSRNTVRPASRSCRVNLPTAGQVKVSDDEVPDDTESATPVSQRIGEVGVFGDLFAAEELPPFAELFFAAGAAFPTVAFAVSSTVNGTWMRSRGNFFF